MYKLAFSALGLAVGCSCLAGTTKPYQIVTEEWAPYNYSVEGRLKGISTDIVQGIMAQTGDHFPILVLPSLRTAVALDRGPRIIMYSLFRTPAREHKYKWIGPILEESVYPYKLRGLQPAIRSIEDLKSLSHITCRHGGTVPARLKSLGFDNLDMSATESIQLYKMLLSGHAEVIIGDTDLGVHYYIDQLNVPHERLEKIPIEVFRSSLYIAFSADADDATVNAWRLALKRMKDSGQLDRIRATYDIKIKP